MFAAGGVFGRRRLFEESAGRPLGGRFVVLRRSTFETRRHGQIDGRPILIHGPQGQGQPAHGNDLVRLKYDGALHRSTIDADRTAPVEDGHPNIAPGVKADVPAREIRVFKNEVAGVVAAERGFLVAQGDLGARVHAGQYLHCPDSFRHGSRLVDP